MSARVAPPNASEVWLLNRRRVLGGGLIDALHIVLDEIEAILANHDLDTGGDFR